MVSSCKTCVSSQYAGTLCRHLSSLPQHSGCPGPWCTALSAPSWQRGCTGLLQLNVASRGLWGSSHWWGGHDVLGHLKLWSRKKLASSYCWAGNLSRATRNSVTYSLNWTTFWSCPCSLRSGVRSGVSWQQKKSGRWCAGLAHLCLRVLRLWAQTGPHQVFPYGQMQINEAHLCPFRIHCDTLGHTQALKLFNNYDASRLFLCSVSTMGQKKKVPNIATLLKQLQRLRIWWENTDATQRDRGKGIKENFWFAFQCFIREMNVGHTKLHSVWV